MFPQDDDIDGPQSAASQELGGGASVDQAVYGNYPAAIALNRSELNGDNNGWHAHAIEVGPSTTDWRLHVTVICGSVQTPIPIP